MDRTGQANAGNPVALATVDEMRERIRRKRQLKGRQVDAAAVREVRALIGTPPGAGHRRDLLIEHLHELNDAHLCLHDRHLVALASEMNIPMAEVYEVATFYHHFEVLKGDAAAPKLTLRVCDGLSCELAGAGDLLARLAALLGSAQVRVVPAPCLGRCEQAPVAVVHQNPVPMATPERVLAAVNAAARMQPAARGSQDFAAAGCAQQSVSPAPEQIQVSPDYAGYATYRAHGGYALAAAPVPISAEKSRP